MDYLALKHAHSGLAYLSILLFIVRFGLYQWRESLSAIKILNIVPHVINTGLLIAAIALCISIGQYPVTDAWVTAKVIGLLAYIGLGIIAIKRKNWVAFALSLVVVAYMIGVAKSHSVLSWLV